MAAADLNVIRATIETHLLAGFNAQVTTQSGDILVSQGGLTIVTESPEAGPTPLVFRNQAYEPTPGDSFVQCLVSFGASSYLTLGGTSDSSNRIDGSIEVNVFTPLGVGPGANYDLASRVCTLYTRDIIEGIQFEALSGPSVVTASEPPSFFQSTVTVPFNVFETL
jgi:hypothetical protein